ncbi:molybdopterin molybdotransferase MoeA [Herbiconiux liukaitaii]|uniref:molybdopterin molybdotransferase MoeA n=1 Tax=Herbiconiux liukaitaii TaxID=3342799 RepID=UPI0035B9E23D
MRTIDDHRREITALLAPLAGGLGSETLPVSGEALAADPARYRHRVLAHDVVSPSSLPSFDNSQMDGYAVRSADLASASPDAPVSLPVAARVAAGDAFGVHSPGTATPIMTGAAVPAGADAVVQIERAVPPTFPPAVSASLAGPTDPTGEADGSAGGGPVGESDGFAGGGATSGAAGGRVVVRVAFVAPVEAGTFVRAAGSDIRAGEVLLRAGTVLGPPQFGVIAGTGATEVQVRRRVRVLLVSTGHEIREAGTELAPGQIFDANTVALTAALLEIGCTVLPRPCRSDDAADLLDLLRREAGGVDLVVTVGGVSAGAREVVRDALGPLGVEFMKVAMQPGGPQGFGRIQLAAGTASDAATASNASTAGTDNDASISSDTGTASELGSANNAGTTSDTGTGTTGDADSASDAGGAGVARGLPVVCLPGNPVSALVSFEAFLRPALLATLGAAPLRETRRAPSAEAFDSPPRQHQLRRGILDADGRLSLRGGPSSHLLHSYAESTVLVHVPVGTTHVADGDDLDFWRIDG